jgi:Protein of unknown function (DUF1571)
MNSLGKALGTALSLLIGCLIVVQSAGRANDKQVIPAVAVAVADLDQAIAWMTEAKRNYTAVKDYTCMLVTQERVNGKLQEQNFMQLKMKTEPLSVYMRWLGPEKNKGQEVVFVLGKNNNKMRVKTKILGGTWVSIDPNDKRVTEHSRHTIVETGIGNMIEQSLIQWQKDRVGGKTDVKIAAFKCNDKECHRIELIRLAKAPGEECYRSVIYLEKGSKLPIRLENYAWPVANGPAGGELLEMFNYVNLEFNVGLTAADFNK